MAKGIFVSHRRDDTRQAAGRLADGLADHFGSVNIFRDIEGIDLGVGFAQALDQALEACVVMLVLIGPKWLEITDAQGKRRLDDPRDWIRQEISTALRRGIRVVPVLIDGTPLPDESALSDDLKPPACGARSAARPTSSRCWPAPTSPVSSACARAPTGNSQRRCSADARRRAACARCH